MKKKFCAVLAASMALAALSGCYHDPNEHAKIGVPFIKDKITAKYDQRSVSDAFDAAKAVINKDGTLLSETTNHPNDVRVVYGKINQRDVWVSVQAIEPKVTQVTVQARNSAGGSDIDLAAQVNLEIGLKLAAR